MKHKRKTKQKQTCKFDVSVASVLLILLLYTRVATVYLLNFVFFVNKIHKVWSIVTTMFWSKNNTM